MIKDLVKTIKFINPNICEILVMRDLTNGLRVNPIMLIL